MRKKYISEEIGNDITKWRSGKIIIQAQTGRGKSTFILEEAIPYWLKEGKKVLILVNRNSLRKQYIYQQALSQDTYETGVKIKTYQEFAGEIRKEGKLVDAFYNYDVVVLDECIFSYLIRTLTRQILILYGRQYYIPAHNAWYLCQQPWKSYSRFLRNIRNVLRNQKAAGMA